MLNQYYYDLAIRASEISGLPAKWIYAQWYHETGGFTSALCVDHNNLGGITQVTPNDLPQPDGSLYYMEFYSPEDYAEYFGHYLTLYEEDGIYEATNIREYAEALKHGGYFGDSVDNYVAGMTDAYEGAFGDE